MKNKQSEFVFNPGVGKSETIKTFKFSKQYKNFTTERDDRISITSVYATGADMGEMVSNIELYAEDWHGNPVELPFESLHQRDDVLIRADIAEFLHNLMAEELGNDGEPITSYCEYND